MRLPAISNNEVLLASVMAALSLGFAPHRRQVGRNHLLRHGVKACFMSPAESLLRFGRVTNQDVDLGGTKVTSVDLNQHLPRAGLKAFFIDARTLPFDRSTDTRKGLFDELADRMAFAGGQHIVIGSVLLNDHPHAFDIIARMAPVAHRVQVAKIKLVLQAEFNRRDRSCDLASYKGFTARWAFVIE